METSAVDIIVVAFNTLKPEEQADALERLNDLRLRKLAGEESETARMIRSLAIVRDHVGRIPSVEDYRLNYAGLKEQGHELEEAGRIIRYFGSWRRAKEALELSTTTTARKIDARFRARRLGKVWRYTEETLRETMALCVEHYGRPPTIAEFEWWRERQLELAKAEGNDALHLPSPTPYRKRWGTWLKTLEACGYDPKLSGTRLEQQ